MKPLERFWRCLGHVMAWEHRPPLQWDLSFADAGETDAALEVKYGGGMGIRGMAGRARAGFVAGIDHSTDMVRPARWRNAGLVRAGRGEIRHGGVRCVVLRADARSGED